MDLRLNYCSVPGRVLIADTDNKAAAALFMIAHFGKLKNWLCSRFDTQCQLLVKACPCMPPSTIFVMLVFRHLSVDHSKRANKPQLSLHNLHINCLHFLHCTTVTTRSARWRNHRCPTRNWKSTVRSSSRGKSKKQHCQLWSNFGHSKCAHGFLWETLNEIFSLIESIKNFTAWAQTWL